MILDILNSSVWILVGMVEVSAMTVQMLGILLDSAVEVLRGLVLTVMVGELYRCLISMREIKEWVK